MDNPQAFPHVQFAGMTLRDYFAGQALMGILGGGKGVYINDVLVLDFESVATSTYLYADAMLKEISKEKS